MKRLHEIISLNRTNMVQTDQLFLVNKYYVGGFTEFRNLKNIISLTAVKLKIVPVINLSKPII